MSGVREELEDIIKGFKEELAKGLPDVDDSVQIELKNIIEGLKTEAKELKKGNGNFNTTSVGDDLKDELDSIVSGLKTELQSLKQNTSAEIDPKIQQEMSFIISEMKKEILILKDSQKPTEVLKTDEAALNILKSKLEEN